MPPTPKTIEKRRQQVNTILPILKRTYPDARCSLDYTNPLELLVATILSAQCTDARVNFVTKTLFKKYKSAKDYAAVPQETLEKDIQTTGFYRNKAKALRSMAKDLVDLHNGQVPQTMEDLHALHGVGRKTANVVLGNAFHTPAGVTVDTHVTRLSNRLGLTTHPSDAVKIEQDLIEIVPKQDWTLFSHLLIAHGRALCTARNPKCHDCPLLPHCPAGQKLVRTAKATPKKK